MLFLMCFILECGTVHYAYAILINVMHMDMLIDINNLLLYSRLLSFLIFFIVAEFCLYMDQQCHTRRFVFLIKDSTLFIQCVSYVLVSQCSLTQQLQWYDSYADLEQKKKTYRTGTCLSTAKSVLYPDIITQCVKQKFSLL